MACNIYPYQQGFILLHVGDDLYCLVVRPAYVGVDVGGVAAGVDVCVGYAHLLGGLAGC